MRLKRRYLEEQKFFTRDVPAEFDAAPLLARLDALEKAVKEKDARIEELLTDLATRPEPPAPEEKVKAWTFDVVKDQDGAIVRVDARPDGSASAAAAPKPSMADILFSKG